MTHEGAEYPLSPPLPRNEKLPTHAEGKTGQTERLRDQEEGAGMTQDCSGFGAMAAVSNVRWEDLIICLKDYNGQPLTRTLTAHLCVHVLYFCACSGVFVSILKQNSRESREAAAAKTEKMRGGGKWRDWGKTWMTHEKRLCYVGMDLQHVVCWGHTERELDIQLTEMKYIHLCQP